MRDLKYLYKEWRKYQGDKEDLYPPLTKAVRERDFFRLAQLLLEKPDLECEAITEDRYALRPIHFAADVGGDATSAALLTMLLDAGANPNVRTRDVRDWDNP